MNPHSLIHNYQIVGYKLSGGKDGPSMNLRIDGYSGDSDFRLNSQVVVLCLAPHSTHLLSQNLDVKLFSSSGHHGGRLVADPICNGLRGIARSRFPQNHWQDLNLCFKPTAIQSTCRGTNLVTFNPFLPIYPVPRIPCSQPLG